MEMLLLLVLILTEIGFAAFAMSGKITRGEWAKRRLCVSAVELVTFLVMTLLPGIDFSFRFKGVLVILVLQLIISAIFWLIRRKKETAKGKPSIVIRTVLGILIISLAMIPAFIFTDYHGRPLSGEYSVAETEAILIDSSRADEFENDGSYREVPVHFFYPESTDAIKAHSLPLVVFSHGAFGYYQSNMSAYMELASNGYVVIALDHPHHSFFTTDSAGKTVPVDMGFIQSAIKIENNEYDAETTFDIMSKAMKLRLDDMNFVLDTIKSAVKAEPDGSWAFSSDGSRSDVGRALSLIDTEKIGLFGHSMGGATSVTAGRRSDVSAVIDLDGTMFGEVLGIEDGEEICSTEPYATPVLDVRNQNHQESCEEAYKLQKDYVNNVIMDNAADGHTTYFKGSGHMNFTDLPLISPFIAKALGTGNVDPEVCIDQVNTLVLRFFDHYLKGSGIFTVEESY